MNVDRATSSGTIENIQALRGVAALLVLYAHVWRLIHLQDPFVALTHEGAIGVDLFFVISGFVICLTASKRHHSAGDFLIARLARVVPLYLSATLFHVTSHLLLPPAFVQSNPSLISTWNGIFYLPLFDWNQYNPPPIIVGWTLSFEMWFYLMFTFCLLFCKPTRAAVLLPLLFAVGALAGMCYRGEWYLPRFMTHPFVLEFAFGCVIYQMRRHIRGILPWLLPALAVAYFILFSRDSGYLGYNIPELGIDEHLAWLRVLLWGVPVALLVAGMVGLELTRTFILPKPLVWMGGISYSLYVIHWPLLEIYSQIAGRLHIHSPWILGLTAVALCLSTATLCYYKFELPLTNRAQKWARSLSTPRPAEAPAPPEAIPS